MAERLTGDCGGILGILVLAEDPVKGRALESDLVNAGLRLRWVNDELHDFTWRDLKVFIAEAGPGTALFRAHNPEWVWDQHAMLLADIADGIRILAWQKTKDAQSKRNQPKPIPRPGIGPDKTEKQHKGTGVPVNEFAARRAAFFQNEVNT